MKIQYQYTEYKDFPEATEISNERARMATVFSMLLFSCLGLSLIFLLAFEEDRIISALMLILSLAGLYYIRNHYPKATEKKIKKAIQKKMEMESEAKESKYKCKYIQLLDKCREGTCQSCYEKGRQIILCKIKNNIGTREIYVCNDCIQKYRSSSET